MKCDGLGEQAVSSHGQVRGACGSTEALRMAKAPPAHTARRKTFLGLRGTLSWAKHGRPLFQALQALLSNHPKQTHRQTRATKHCHLRAVLPITAHRYSSEPCPRCQPSTTPKVTPTRFARQQPILARVNSSAPFGACLRAFSSRQT